VLKEKGFDKKNRYDMEVKVCGVVSALRLAGPRGD
jgi:hypothetical protein